MSTLADDCEQPNAEVLWNLLLSIPEGLTSEFRHARYDLNPGILLGDIQWACLEIDQWQENQFRKLIESGHTCSAKRGVKCICQIDDWHDYFPRTKNQKKIKTDSLPIEHLVHVSKALVNMTYSDKGPTMPDLVARRLAAFVQRRVKELHSNSHNLSSYPTTSAGVQRVRHRGAILIAPDLFFRHLATSGKHLIIPVQTQMFRGPSTSAEHGWSMDQFLRSFNSLSDFLDEASKNDLHLIYIIDIRPKSDVEFAQYLNWIETETLYRAAMEDLVTRGKRPPSLITWFVPDEAGQRDGAFLYAQRTLFDKPPLRPITSETAFHDAGTTPLMYAAGIHLDGGTAEYALTLEAPTGTRLPSYNINGKPMIRVAPDCHESMTPILTEFVRAAVTKGAQCRCWRRLSLEDFLCYPAHRAFSEVKERTSWQQ